MGKGVRGSSEREGNKKGGGVEDVAFRLKPRGGLVDACMRTGHLILLSQTVGQQLDVDPPHYISDIRSDMTTLGLCWCPSALVSVLFGWIGRVMQS